MYTNEDVSDIITIFYVILCVLNSATASKTPLACHIKIMEI